eukprot:m.247157 g.247157  ORF g.247157 m.247157 type:complete len:267 (-) comp19492_c0_seq1:909-1709(-)
MGGKSKSRAKEPKLESLKEYADGSELDLSFQDRSEIPVRELLASPQWTRVNLSGNKITKISADLGSLTHLVELNLGKNGFKEIPDTLGELIRLKKFDVRGNRLSKLPYTLAKLQNLRWLDLSENPINEGFLSRQTVGPCASEEDCRACAKQVRERVAELWKKKLKNDERLERKREREAAAQALIDKERKAEEKQRRRKEWLAKQQMANGDTDEGRASESAGDTRAQAAMVCVRDAVPGVCVEAVKHNQSSQSARVPRYIPLQYASS